MSFTVCILTVSDRCSRGEASDTSGPAIAQVVRERLKFDVISTALVADEVSEIAKQLKDWAHSQTPPSLILTTGGTGLSPRDVTPEATATVLEKKAPQLLELARYRALPGTPRAFLSRGEAGVVGRTLIINLPGSVKGAVQTIEALADLLPHALATVAGRDEHIR